MKRNTGLFVGLLVCVAGIKPTQAEVKPYSVTASMKKVSNFRSFTKAIPLTPQQKAMLAKNLFVCTPTEAKQLFQIYEHNDYLNLPSFVTTDTVLQLYHIFYDFILRNVETNSLMPVLQRLTEGMFNASVETWKSVEDEKLKQAALKNIAYFGVAARALGMKPNLPPEAADLVQKEVALMDKHEGFKVGAIFPYKIDYSQFIPRGHYTRSDTLKEYFRGMMWYGLAPFSLRYITEQGQKVRAEEQIRQSLLFVRSLYQNKLENDWMAIYEPTAFYVGTADDLTPTEWEQTSTKVFGQEAPIAAFADESKLDAFVAAAETLRAAAIQPKFGRAMGVSAGTPDMIDPPFAIGNQLRFMGQRYIPDSEILQRLCEPPARVFPSGLDVMAVLGSKRTQEIIDTYPQIYNTKDWAGYQPEREKLTREFAEVKPETWTSNLYWSWLNVLKALLEPASSVYPSFMRKEAWLDKSLHTALASWAELRHDTILYAKQSVVECGGGEEPPFVKGYVEPNVIFYNRLLKLTKDSREGLDKRKLLSTELKERFEKFEDLLTFLKTVSEKELRNQRLTNEQYLEIRYIGGELERMTLSVMEGNPNTWELVSEADRDMAAIADVHTGMNKALEEGVGHAYEILVIVPVEGKLQLTRGAVFSYYEFRQPVSDRLTDEKWQAALKAGKAPEPPVWTKAFLVPTGSRRLKASEFEKYSSGC